MTKFNSEVEKMVDEKKNKESVCSCGQCNHKWLQIIDHEHEISDCPKCGFDEMLHHRPATDKDIAEIAKAKKFIDYIAEGGARCPFCGQRADDTRTGIKFSKMHLRSPARCVCLNHCRKCDKYWAGWFTLGRFAEVDEKKALRLDADFVLDEVFVKTGTRAL